MKFEDLKLSYGYALQLQTANSVGQVERFACRLIGCVPGRSILLSVPKQGGKLVKFRPNQKIVMRFMIDNGVGLFASAVEFQTLEPYPIIHVVYPELLNFKGIRSATRVAVTQNVLVVNNSESPPVSVSGSLVDISISGARLELRGGFGAIGDCLSIKSPVVIRDVEQELSLSVVVRSLVELSEGPDGGDLVGYGVEFLVHSEQERLVIYAYVFNQMALQESISK
jgi:c-di-GMP-binding flagellar brake protein YcgR